MTPEEIQAITDRLAWHYECCRTSGTLSTFHDMEALLAEVDAIQTENAILRINNNLALAEVERLKRFEPPKASARCVHRWEPAEKHMEVAPGGWFCIDCKGMCNV